MEFIHISLLNSQNLGINDILSIVKKIKEDKFRVKTATGMHMPIMALGFSMYDHIRCHPHQPRKTSTTVTLNG